MRFLRKTVSNCYLYIDDTTYHYVYWNGDYKKIPEGYYFYGESIEDDNFNDTTNNLSNRYLGLFNEIRKNAPTSKISLSIALSVTKNLLRVVYLPNMNAEEAKKTIGYSLEDFFPFSSSEAVFDLAPIQTPDRADGTFLVAATRRTEIDTLMEAARLSGISINFIEPAQLSIERAISPTQHLHESELYLYVGNNRIVMIISWKGNGIFYKDISLTRIKREAEAARDSVEIIDAVLQELHSAIFFASSNASWNRKNVDVIIAGRKQFGYYDNLIAMLEDVIPVSDVTFTDPELFHGFTFPTDDVEAGMLLGLMLR